MSNLIFPSFIDTYHVREYGVIVLIYVSLWNMVILTYSRVKWNASFRSGRLSVVVKKNGRPGEYRPKQPGGIPTRKILKITYKFKYMENHNKKWLIMFITLKVSGSEEIVHSNEE